jgi:CheY-like chemotaxis protein
MNILFVDDDANVLNGLRRILRSRREWRTLFANSGPEALEVLATTPIDVIVTDMRMPGMDGADLLHAVEERYPDVVRIVLSGYVDADRGDQAAQVAHAWLHKPCDPEALEQAIATH